MPNIALEISWAQKAGGARRVTAQTLLEMVRLRPDYLFSVYSNTPIQPFIDTPIFNPVFPCPKFIPQIIWDQFLFPHHVLPQAVKKGKPDLLHFTNNIISFKKHSIPTVVTIHDMTPFILPHSYSLLHGAYQRAYIRFAARHASKIITISENSKIDICRILNVKKRRIAVIPNGCSINSPQDNPSLEIDLNEKFGIKGPYILFVGAIHPRKNIQGLLRAFERLKNLCQIPHQLVIAGAKRWKTAESLPRSLLNILKNSIVFTDRISDLELGALYKDCAVFVYPSFYEGFGLPILEAMSFGAPVATSKTSCLPEVAGDAALFFDPTNPDEIADTIYHIIDDSTLRDDLIKKGRERVKLFTWENTARKTLELYESLL